MVQEKKQQQLGALDSQYQAKIMSEVERYQALLQEKELLNHKWDEQNATLVEAHEKVLSA
jgi:cilia- and flagella-associated protein 57